jgi:hypothetical protein
MRSACLSGVLLLPPSRFLKYKNELEFASCGEMRYCIGPSEVFVTFRRLNELQTPWKGKAAFFVPGKLRMIPKPANYEQSSLSKGNLGKENK